jgi:glycosyltransferase involved in cell wall biosynthesis
VKVALPQDEFIHADALCRFITDFEVDVVLSTAPASEWRKIYRAVPPDVRFDRVLTGYVDESLVPKVRALSASISRRDIDVGYRAWHAAPWLGRHGKLKIDIAERFADAAQPPLVTDISTRDEDVIVGDDWFRFLLRCRAVLGVEGGASILDWDGSIKDATERFLADRPSAAFEEIEAACFSGIDGSLDLRAVSPRAFEAAATRTCQLLVEGEYNGILRPWEHYVPVRRDFSNVDEVLDFLADAGAVAAMADRAYDDLVASGRYTYGAFVSHVLDAALADHGGGSDEGPRTAVAIHRARASEYAGRWSLALRWDIANFLASSLRRIGVGLQPVQVLPSWSRFAALGRRLWPPRRRDACPVVVSVTPIAVIRDTRTFKEAASYARLGYRSIVIECEESDVDRNDLPFELRTVRLRLRPSATTGRRPLGWRSLGQVEARLIAPLRLLPRAAVYHLHEFSRFPAIAIAKVMHGSRVIYDAHDFYQAEFEGLQRPVIARAAAALEAVCVAASDAVVTVGEGVAALYAERFGVTPVVLRNSHDERLDRRPKERLREAVGVREEDFLIVTVGMHKREVPIDAALRALSILPERVHWAWVGDGYDDERARVHELGLDERAHFVGAVKPFEVVPFIASADVAAILYQPFSSNFENALPNKFFQAVAAGLPILVPPLAELRRLALDRGLGIAIDPAAPESIAQAVRTLLETSRLPALRAAVTRAKEEYSWRHDEEVLEFLLRDLGVPPTVALDCGS